MVALVNSSVKGTFVLLCEWLHGGRQTRTAMADVATRRLRRPRPVPAGNTLQTQPAMYTLRFSGISFCAVRHTAFGTFPPNVPNWHWHIVGKELLMKAVRIHQFGGPEVLAYEDVPDPKPRKDQVLIRVRACALNHLD